MNNDEAKELLHDLLMCGFGISGHSHWNGADWYQCSACGATKDTMGNASSFGAIDDVDHKEDCGLIKLLEWSKS